MAGFNSGTSNVSTDPTFAAAGDLLIGTADDAGSVLSVGSSNNILNVTCGTPAWTDSPTLGDLTLSCTIELGHACDTTLARASAGEVNIQGNRIYRAGGTTVPVGDGGTGACTLLANGILVGNGTSAIAVTATMATKGHVMIGDGSGVPTMLAVGSNCQVLTACSSEATGVKWEDAGGSARTVAGTADNGIVTFVNCGSTFAAEAGLTFDATTLSLQTDTGTGNTAGLNIMNSGAASTCRKSFIRFAQNRTTGGETSAAWLFSSLTNIACSGYTGKLNINVASNGAPGAVMEITRAAVAHYGGCENTPGITFLCDLDTGFYRPGANVLGIVNGGGCAEGARFDRGAGNSGGRLLQGDCENSNQAAGITSNVLSHNDQIWATKSSDVVHGMTATGETDTFGAIFKINDGWGGIRMHGWTENICAFIINGYQSAGNNAKSTGASSALKLNGAMKGTTNVGAMCANTNIVNISEDGVVRFIFDKEGSGHSDVEWTTYDDYQDIELLRGVHGALMPDFKKDFGSDMLYNLCTYTELGLVGGCSLHWEQNKEGNWQHRAMVNWQGMSMLHHSAIIQLADKMDARLTALENQVALQGGK